MRADGSAIRRIPYAPEGRDGRRLRLSLPDWQAAPEITTGRCSRPPNRLGRNPAAEP
jgi:hypothetical protein